MMKNFNKHGINTKFDDFKGFFAGKLFVLNMLHSIGNFISKPN